MQILSMLASPTFSSSLLPSLSSLIFLSRYFFVFVFVFVLPGISVQTGGASPDARSLCRLGCSHFCWAGLSYKRAGEKVDTRNVTCHMCHLTCDIWQTIYIMRLAAHTSAELDYLTKQQVRNKDKTCDSWHVMWNVTMTYEISWYQKSIRVLTDYPSVNTLSEC